MVSLESVVKYLDRSETKTKLRHNHSRGNAGADLRAAKWIILEPNESKLVDSNVAVAIPDDMFGLLIACSPRGANRHIDMASVGIINGGYLGTLKAHLRNFGSSSAVLNEGERVVQLVILPFVIPDWEVAGEDVAEGDAECGKGGFASSGCF